MRRNAQVGNDAVNLSTVIELDEILEVPEILRDESETLVVKGIGGGIFVLVEGVEMPRCQPFQDGPRMASTTKSDIGIHAFGVDVQAPDALAQHDWIVIHRAALPYLMFSRILKNSSSVSAVAMDSS